jgi:hypothetical protein
LSLQPKAKTKAQGIKCFSQIDDGRISNNRDIWWLGQRTSTRKNGQDPW